MTKKFYELSPADRVKALSLSPVLEQRFLDQQNLYHQDLVENYLTDFSLPEGMVKDAVVDGQKYQVPLVTEEPSVIAAANNGMRLFRMKGGVKSGEPSHALLGGQIIFNQIKWDELSEFVENHRGEIEEQAQLAKPSLYARGGGIRSINLRKVPGNRASLDLTVETGLAMGANAVNTILEAVKTIFVPYAEQILAAILTNAGHDSVVTVRGQVPVDSLGGLDIAKKIVALSDFAKVDTDRAVTENKGIFNGLSAVVLALGNDWRAVEAAGHAYAARQGLYQSLSTWQLSADEKTLLGELSLPLNIGLVGGGLAGLQQAQDNFKLLGQPTVDEVKKVILAIGLSSNLAALKAITSQGIQAGHMRMQARTLAIQVGARPDEVQWVAERLVAAVRIDEQTAKEILGDLRNHEPKA
ncbi:hypothetical protein [Fructobacillus ficulneus]|uniref:Hydroxymethylglutaryl-CoA reductase n=1 Tax=Fructobacillus ficulneus TaxID=157463 RepID=A0A0K8MFI4_9LACO|nr:hypothetical protein [Fructobacillus ficulneus]GAO99252.1 hydroxymethylglutaryl-CoA reductase [Fructobacillus ficulneus]